MVSFKQVQMMYVDILNGQSKNTSRVPMNSETEAIWDEIFDEVQFAMLMAEQEGQKIDFDVPFENSMLPEF